MLDRLCAELCAAALDIEPGAAGALLAELARRNLFVSALDEELTPLEAAPRL